MMTDKELLEYCLSKEAQALTGWDFSCIGKEYREEKLPWDYREKLLNFLKPESELLDLGTGGGEFLLSLRHPYSQTAVTEGYPPNFELCKRRLEPLGIEVKFSEEKGDLPFADSRFDLIIDRHESYRLDEVFRVLRPGGFFITQQVGGANNRELSEALIPGFRPAMPDFNLENELPKFQKIGFRIMNRSQCYVKTAFTDIGALCYYAKFLPWEFPGFSVKSCFRQIRKLYRQLGERGAIVSTCHRFIIVAKKNWENEGGEVIMTDLSVAGRL